MGTLRVVLLVCFCIYNIQTAPSNSRSRRSVELYKRILTDFKDLLEEEDVRHGGDPSIWKKNNKPGLSWGHRDYPGLTWRKSVREGSALKKTAPGLAWDSDENKKPGLMWGNDQTAEDSQRGSSRLQAASGRGGDTRATTNTEQDYKLLGRMEKILKAGLRSLNDDENEQQTLPNRFLRSRKKDTKILSGKKSESTNEAVLNQLKDIIKDVMKKESKPKDASTNQKRELKRETKDMASLYKRIVDDLNNVFTDQNGPKKR